MRVGVEGAQAAGAKNSAGADRDGAVRDTEQARDMVQARDTEQHGPPREVGAGVRRGHPDASPHPDVRALAFPKRRSYLFLHPRPRLLTPETRNLPVGPGCESDDGEVVGDHCNHHYTTACLVCSPVLG